MRKTSFIEERRRRKSGESSSRPSSRLSLELPAEQKIGRKGKRELLQTFTFRGTSNYAQKVCSNTNFSKFVTVDDTGVFYLLQTMKTSFDTTDMFASSSI
jgi:hypothetical protein